MDHRHLRRAFATIYGARHGLPDEEGKKRDSNPIPIIL